MQVGGLRNIGMEILIIDGNKFYSLILIYSGTISYVSSLSETQTMV